MCRTTCNHVGICRNDTACVCIMPALALATPSPGKHRSSRSLYTLPAYRRHTGRLLPHHMLHATHHQRPGTAANRPHCFLLFRHHHCCCCFLTLMFCHCYRYCYYHYCHYYYRVLSLLFLPQPLKRNRVGMRKGLCGMARQVAWGTSRYDAVTSKDYCWHCCDHCCYWQGRLVTCSGGSP